MSYFSSLPCGLHFAAYASPCGPLTLAAWRGSLSLCDWDCNPRHALLLRHLTAAARVLAAGAADTTTGACGFGATALASDAADADTAVLREAARQLAEWFQGQRRAFRLPLRAVGTPFQREVWRELTAIPYGSTLTYGALARRVGRPAAARAVAAAVAANPLSIIVPCHRVVGAGGAMTGYAGGLAAKRFLLQREGLEVKS